MRAPVFMVKSLPSGYMLVVCSILKLLETEKAQTGVFSAHHLQCSALETQVGFSLVTEKISEEEVLRGKEHHHQSLPLFPFLPCSAILKGSEPRLAQPSICKDD